MSESDVKSVTKEITQTYDNDTLQRTASSYTKMTAPELILTY